MKITKEKLKKIISEEIGYILEVSDDQAQIATAKHLADINMPSSAQGQVNQTNNSHDDGILENIFNLAKNINNLILGLDDSSKKDALVDAVANLVTIADQSLIDGQ